MKHNARKNSAVTLTARTCKAGARQICNSSERQGLCRRSACPQQMPLKQTVKHYHLS